MAKTKRKTLPKNFRELIKLGDISALKAVFETCESTAYEGYNQENALHFYDVPEELARWLVQQGLDVDTPDATYGKTPLWKHAYVGSKLVEALLDLGADVNHANNEGNTPLHMAAENSPETVRLLIARGADVHAKNKRGMTPLAFALARCANAYIPSVAKSAEILLNAGDAITDGMQKSVERIGKDFEFHRENFNKDYLAETDAGLAKLYELFGVGVVARRVTHDSMSLIELPAGTWQEQYNALWEYLVPSQGAAKTVQGEVIRITGKVSDELYRNGGGNWDASFRKMLNALLAHFASGVALTTDDLAESRKLASGIHAKDCSGDDGIDRLCELAVKWVAQNPQPAQLAETEYKR
jgi:hypothetical protein